MRKLLAIAALFLAACAVSEPAYAPDEAPYDPASRFAGPSILDTVSQMEPEERLLEWDLDPNQPVIVDFVGRQPNRGWNPVPGLAPMPFGGGMFGPWDTGEGPGALDADGQMDFVRRDLHTVMHYIALRSDLQIIVEGEVGETLLTSVRLPQGNLTRAEALAILQSICKANKLDYIEDGNVVIIKKRPQDLSLAHVVLSELDGHYNVSFEDHELVAAIMEVATVTKTQVFVPALQPSGDDVIEPVKVTLQMRAALPERILRKLAELGDLEIEQVALKDSVEGAGVGYKFKYRE
jgi:hypothetical protein